MSCYPRIRLQSSPVGGGRSEDRGPEKQEAPEDPTDSDQPVQSIHPLRRGQEEWGVKGRKEQTGPSQPNRQSGKASQTDRTAAATTATAELVQVPAIMPRSPSCPSLPTSFPPTHAATPSPVLKTRSPNSQAVLSSLLRLLGINLSVCPSIHPQCLGRQSSSEQCPPLSLPRFLFPHAPITLPPARQPALESR